MPTFGPAEQIGSGSLALTTPSSGAGVGKTLKIASGSGNDWILALIDAGLYEALRTTEITSTPAGTTQTLTLGNGNHQTLALASATGTVAVTLTVPASSAAGTILIKQHATAAKGLTWASSVPIKWAGAEPVWGSDAVSSERIVSWRYNGSTLYLASTEVFV